MKTALSGTIVEVEKLSAENKSCSQQSSRLKALYEQLARDHLQTAASVQPLTADPSTQSATQLPYRGASPQEIETWKSRQKEASDAMHTVWVLNGQTFLTRNYGSPLLSETIPKLEKIAMECHPSVGKAHVQLVMWEIASCPDTNSSLRVRSALKEYGWIVSDLPAQP